MALDTKVIERVITIDAPPETVFRLLTDPVQYVRWKGRLAELEPRPGGKFRVEFPSTKDIAAGKYVEVIRDPARGVHLGLGRQRDGPARIEHGRDRPPADGIGDPPPSGPPRVAAGRDREPYRRLGLLHAAPERCGRGPGAARSSDVIGFATRS